VAGKGLRRAIWIAAALAVAALVLPPFINVSRYKARVVASMSSALGRPVTVDNVSLRLLPRPGFVLENVVVGDDPNISSEPMLHAEEVTAYFGLSSLWGRLDVTQLSLRYPSLNLVERPGTGWNLESLLWRAQRSQTAPTSARIGEQRTRFPYIVATNGRINFKYGLEKSVFSFVDADFTLLSPAENQWRMRLQARPVRTDMPVTDTGMLKAQIDIQRAAVLRDAPMKATISWENVQLGNLTRLLYGEDRGWRGQLQASLLMGGTPGALQFTSAARLHDLRRFDVSSRDTADLNATCGGELEFASSQLRNTACRMPLGEGALTVRGTLRGLHSPRYDLTLTAEDLPANALLYLARHIKRDLPADLSAEGRIDGTFQARRASDAPSDWIGNLVAQGLVLHSSVLGKDLAVSRAVAFANTAAAPPAPPGKQRGRKHEAPPAEPIRALVVQPFELSLGAAAPASVQGQLDDDRFSVHIKGEATLERLQQFARGVGVGVPKIALTGPASVDLNVGGRWGESTNAPVTGSLQLKNARAEVPGLLFPLEIAAARVEFDGHRLTLRNASASVGKVALTGEAGFPRTCDGDGPCEATLEVATEEFNPELWNDVLNPRLKKRPWYRLFGAEAENNVIANLHATGHLSARRFTLATISGTALDSDFAISDGVAELKNTRAALLGGTVNGGGKLDFSKAEPAYELTGTARDLSAEKLAAATKVALGSGNIGLNYKVQMAGLDSATLASSAAAEGDFTWTGGTLRLGPDGKAPLKVISGHGHAVLNKDGWSISACQWRTPTGIYQLSGTVTRNSELALEFTQENGSVWKLAGTVAKPQMSSPAPPPTQARKR
jgi:AsmA protein